MHKRPAQFDRPAHSGGFTLIELLVVMGIVAILVGLSFRVLSASMENARIEATRATIRHLDSALQDRLEDFERVNFKPLATAFQRQYKIENSTTLPPPPNNNLPLELALLIVKKDRFRAAFPQREEDLWGIDGRIGGGDDSPLLDKMRNPTGSPVWKPDSWKGRTETARTDGIPSTLADDREEAAESSELLYVALTEGAVFGAPSSGIDRIPERHIGDTDNDGNLEFIDDWGRPLRFYNWTTRLIRPFNPAPPTVDPNNAIQQTVFARTVAALMPDVIPPRSSDPTIPTGNLLADDYSHPLNQDGDDVTGALGAALAATSPYDFFLNPFTYNGATDAGKPFDERYYHTPDTYHIPLIVSGGPDERVGLYEPDASDPRTPTASAPGEAQFFRRLGLPLGIDPASPGTLDASLLDLLYDNITNRQP